MAGGLLSALLLSGGGAAIAADRQADLPASAGAPVAVPPLPAAEAISALSDAELTALSVHWSQLSAEQRRVLLKTVRTRMLLTDRAAKGSSPLKPQRRFGRVVRQRDGSVVSIETRVFRSADGTRGSISRRMTFGAGFEQRQRSAQQAPADPGATAAEPSRTATPSRQ